MMPQTARSYRVQSAFRAVDRSDFVPGWQKGFAEYDRPISIGFGQTNSQPSTVAFMLELLDVHSGQSVLDVGSGSCWTTALLAAMVGASGRVAAVERIPELVDFGRRNLSKYPYDWAAVYPAGPRLGLLEKAPFDRILVSAAADGLPADLVAQLAAGGIMVIPIGSEVCKFTRTQDYLKRESYPGFAFVPLINT